MIHGSQQLKAWLARSGYNQREAAKIWGIHWTTLNKWVLGLRPPGREMALLLEEKTGIPVSAWTTAVGKAKKTKPGGRKFAHVGRADTHSYVG